MSHHHNTSWGQQDDEYHEQAEAVHSMLATAQSAGEMHLDAEATARSLRIAVNQSGGFGSSPQAVVPPSANLPPSGSSSSGSTGSHLSGGNSTMNQPRPGARRRLEDIHLESEFESGRTKRHESNEYTAWLPSNSRACRRWVFLLQGFIEEHSRFEVEALELLRYVFHRVDLPDPEPRDLVTVTLQWTSVPTVNKLLDEPLHQGRDVAGMVAALIKWQAGQATSVAPAPQEARADSPSPPTSAEVAHSLTRMSSGAPDESPQNPGGSGSEESQPAMHLMELSINASDDAISPFKITLSLEIVSPGKLMCISCGSTLTYNAGAVANIHQHWVASKCLENSIRRCGELSIGTGEQTPVEDRKEVSLALRLLFQLVYAASKNVRQGIFRSNPGEGNDRSSGARKRAAAESVARYLVDRGSKETLVSNITTLFTCRYGSSNAGDRTQAPRGIAVWSFASTVQCLADILELGHVSPRMSLQQFLALVGVPESNV